MKVHLNRPNGERARVDLKLFAMLADFDGPKKRRRAKGRCQCLWVLVLEAIKL